MARGVMTVVVAALLLPLAVGAPGHAAPSADRLAIGDSVMLGAAPQLKARGFRVDATESRQSYTGPALLRGRGSSLPGTVVVHLGTNGSFPLDVCRRIVRNAGPDRRVFLVTVHVPRSWQDANNRVIRQCDRSFADGRVTVVDWHDAARRNPGWLYRDGVHLTPAGARAFARLIDRAVDSSR